MKSEMAMKPTIFAIAKSHSSLVTSQRVRERHHPARDVLHIPDEPTSPSGREEAWQKSRARLNQTGAASGPLAIGFPLRVSVHSQFI
jgi:hypothetical protein